MAIDFVGGRMNSLPGCLQAAGLHLNRFRGRTQSDERRR